MTRLFKFWKRDSAKGVGLFKSRRGNVALITAFMMIPLTVALGTAYDFTMAESRQDQIDGMADIATLGGVTPTQMAKPYATVLPFSQNLFMSQLASVNGVTSVVPTWGACTGAGDSSSGATVVRTMCVTYTAASVNVFANLLGMPTFPLKGSSTATSSTAPNIDFYLLMDTSPSMEIAATTVGINTLIANTQQESDGTGTTDTWTNPPAVYEQSSGKFKASPNGNGCAFGCHESVPSEGTYADPTGHPIKCTATGTYADAAHTPFQAWATGDPLTPPYTFPSTGHDNYDLSRCLGVTLRIDLLNTAAQNLMDVATTTSANDNAAYRMAIYETSSNAESNPNTLHLVQGLTANLATAKTSAATLASLEMCNNNHYACGDGNNDEDTDLDGDLVSMNSTTVIPNPGNGTNNASDTPQEVLFIVTDAQNDYARPSYLPIDWSGAKCTAIKNRGIRIAVLYTTYMPLEESWYQTAVQPSLASVGAGPNTGPPSTDVLATAASNCASPGLYYSVSTDGDISAALTHLFQEAIATARLLH
jgi:hypothetical protein